MVNRQEGRLGIWPIWPVYIEHRKMRDYGSPTGDTSALIIIIRLGVLNMASTSHIEACGTSVG